MPIACRAFHARVSLDASHMGRDCRSIDRAIEDALRRTYGDACHEEGYMLGESIMLDSRGVGVVDTTAADGSMVYEVRYTASIFDLNEGGAMRCLVVKKNEEGMRLDPVPGDQAVGGLYSPQRRGPSPPLDVVLPILYHDAPTQTVLSKVKVGDVIGVTVLGTRFLFGDRNMRVVVRYGSDDHDERTTNEND